MHLPPPRQHEAGDSQVVSTDVWNENLDAAAAVIVHIQCANRNKKLLLAYYVRKQCSRAQ